MADISHLTFEEASRTIVDYIELYYNSERLHSGIGYYIPNHFSLFYLSTNLDKFRTKRKSHTKAGCHKDVLNIL